MTTALPFFLFSTMLVALVHNAQSEQQQNVPEAIPINTLEKYVVVDTLPSPLDYKTSTEAPVTLPVTLIPYTEAIIPPTPSDTRNDSNIDCDNRDANAAADDNGDHESRSLSFQTERCRHHFGASQDNHRVSQRMKPPQPLPEATTTIPVTTPRPRFDCKCEVFTCKCCAHISFPAVRLDKDICITFTYDPEGATLKIAIDIGGWVIYKDQISAVDPKPMCYSLPNTNGFAQLCAELVDVKITPTTISGCFNVYAKLLGAKVGQSKVGCWKLGPFPIPFPVPTTSSTTTTTPGTTTSPKPFDCNCQGYTCKCCVHLKWPKVNLDKLACLSFTYDPVGITLNVKLDLSGWVLFEKTISALNPPPICVSLPFAFNFAMMCTQMYDGKLEKDSFSGCFKAYAKLLGKTVGETKLGCFSIPLKKS